MMRMTLTGLVLFVVLILTPSDAVTSCNNLLNVQAIQAGEWTATLKVPLTQALSKFSDHWEIRIKFAHPVIDIQGVSSQLSVSASTLGTTSFSSTSLQGEILTRQLDSRTFDLRQDTFIDRQTFQQPHASLDVNFRVAFPGSNLSVDTITFSNVLICSQ